MSVVAQGEYAVHRLVHCFPYKSKSVGPLQECVAARLLLLHGADMADRPFLLTVRALGKSVPGPRLLFRNLDLEVAANELVAIIGESGVGGRQVDAAQHPGGTG